MSSNIELIASGDYTSNKDRILTEISHLQKDNPSLYRALLAMVEDLDHVVIQLNPIEEGTVLGSLSVELPPTPVAAGYEFTALALKVSWTAASPAGTTFTYEVRSGGTGWDDATFELRTSSTSAAFDPTTGVQTFRIKALNINGGESPGHASVAVPAPSIGTPSVAAQVIDNNVLLTWTKPTSSYNIDYYIIEKDSVEVGQTKGTFFTLFETTSSTYVYGVKAVDIAGNEGPVGTVSAIVDQPPDFVLEALLDYDESAGTHSNTYYEVTDGKIHGPVDLTETYEEHFNVDQSWASPQAQVDDGYDYFIQENEGPGVWTSAEMDLGSLLANVILNVFYTVETYTGTNPVSIGIEIRGGATPGAGSFVSGQSQFFASVRYVTLRFTLTPDTADSFCRISDVECRADVKNVVDGNVIYCEAADSAGTPVEIPGDITAGHGSKTFSDVNSITLGVIEDDLEAVTALYDFVDAPDPTEFKILCFDNAGRRVDAYVGWKIRGIEA